MSVSERLVCCQYSVYLQLCPFVCQTIHLYVWMCVCLSVYIGRKQTWIFPPVDVTIHLPEYVNVCPYVFCIQLHICAGVFPMFVSMSTFMCTCLCICLPLDSIRCYVSDKQTDRRIYQLKDKRTHACREADIRTYTQRYIDRPTDIQIANQKDAQR